MTPAIYNLPNVQSGNSIQEQNIATITYQIDSSAIPLSSGEIKVYDNDGCLFATWNAANNKISITGASQNIVTKAMFTGAETKLWPLGKYTYELVVTLQSGEIWSILEGGMNVL
jgi:hypothetical protein